MMSKEQISTVVKVYRKFHDLDLIDTQWTELDEYMYLLDWLEDKQITIEASVLLKNQSSGNPRCNSKHSQSECFVPTILEAIGYILELYSNTNKLHIKNRFILQYYISISQIGIIQY